MKCPKCKYEWIPVTRLRSTGRYSQSAHLHGHLQQIAKELGYSMEEIKAVMKMDCVEWRHQVIHMGSAEYLVPVSESKADTAMESAAIEWTHQKAAELGIRLVEEAR